MFRFEMHTHCAPISRCASATPQQVIELYKAAGYHGLVSTNHINGDTFRQMEGQPWKEKVAYFLTGYEELRKAAGSDFDVLLGCELRLRGSGNDYLIFGVTADWLLDLEDPTGMNLRELSGRVHADGLMLYQAHPFRYGMTLVNEQFLDGIEVYNANKNHDSHNYLSALWAEKKGLPVISGSDFHEPHANIAGGILTQERIRDNRMLLDVLRSQAYTLISAEG